MEVSCELEVDERYIFQLLVIRALTDSFGAEISYQNAWEEKVKPEASRRQREIIGVSLPLLGLTKQQLLISPDWSCFKAKVSELLIEIYLYCEQYYTFQDTSKSVFLDFPHRSVNFMNNRLCTNHANHCTLSHLI